MKILRIIIAFPFSLIYGFILLIRNLMFDLQLLKSHAFSVPLIVVGNLSVGGSGKTPLVEYLTRLLLEKNKNMAIVSRGYGRRSSGYKEVNVNDTSAEVGDEPLQMKQKFPQIKVAVCESRADGIRKLLNQYPDLELLLLDDAFQHRYVQAGLSILATDFNRPFWKDYLLPSGNLREGRSGAKRSDILVVTKVLPDTSESRLSELNSMLKTAYEKEVVFMSLHYEDLRSNDENRLKLSELNDYDVVLFSGIADPSALLDFLHSSCNSVRIFTYKDHHQFSNHELEKVIESYSQLNSKNKILLTTEKDFSRLRNTSHLKAFETLPLYYIPVELKCFNEESASKLKQIIRDYVR